MGNPGQQGEVAQVAQHQVVVAGRGEREVRLGTVLAATAKPHAGP